METLFQYVVIGNPTADERKAGVRSEILVPLSNVLAANEEEVKIDAISQISKENLEKYRGRITMTVCPF